MEFRVLGPLEAERDGDVVDLGPRKQREVLSLLLMHPGRVVTTERILDAVWGEDASSKENALWVTISRLRSVLDPDRADDGDTVLVTRDHGYALEVDPDEVDARRFEALAAEGRRQLEVDPARAAETLEAALALWRGDAWPDVRFHDFAQAEINGLDERRLAAAEDLLDARIRLGETDGVVPRLEALTVDQPLRERPVRLLMVALYRSGRQAEALRSFADFERRIGEEMGLEPSPELRRLEEQVLLHDRSVRSPTAATIAGGNPFKGLQPFREEDAADFFGRDRLTADLIRRIGEGETLITLVGASGSGKSSVVRAGVVPAIRKAALPGSDGWVVATMVPGVHPITELEAALIRASLESPASLGDQLHDPDDGFLRAALRVLPDDRSRLVLVVDQFEELFTLADEAQRDRFLQGLLTATSDHRRRVVVILTLRADFYDRPLQHPEFATRFGDGVVNVPPLLPDELEDAALKPAERVGATIEPALVGALLSDVLGRPGSLPLFQYVLTDLFDRHDGHLGLDDYRAIGGIGGALSTRAEEMYAGLDDDERTACRQLFLRMVAIAEGSEWSRRRLHADELRSMGIQPEMLQAVVGRLIGARLLTTDRDPTSGRPTIEVAHEALMMEWDRLSSWIEDAQDDLRRHARLAVAVREWQESEQDPGYLWGGTRLDDYRAWAARSVLDLTVDEQLFLAESAATRDVQEEQVANVERRTRRRGWGLVAAVVGLVAVGLWAAWPLLFPPPPPPLAVMFVADVQGDISDQHTQGLSDAAVAHGVETRTVVLQTNVELQIAEALEDDPAVAVVALDVDGIDWGEILDTHPGLALVNLSNVPSGHPREVWVEFADEDGAFLAGALAAHRTQTGSIGFIQAIPGVNSSWRQGFEQGARFVDPSVRVESIYSVVWDPRIVWADWEMVGAGTRALIDADADVVIAAHGPSASAVFTEASLAERRVWGIGVDSDKYLDLRTSAPAEANHVLSSVIKEFRRAIVLGVGQALDGVYTDVTMEVANDGFSMATTGGKLTDDDLGVIEGARRHLIEAGIGDDWVPTPPTLRHPTDHTMEVLHDGTRCRFDEVPPIGLGDTLAVDLEATGGPWAGVLVGRLAAPVPGEEYDSPEDDWVGGLEFETTFPHSSAWAPGGGGDSIFVGFDEPGTWVVACRDAGTVWTRTFEVAP